MKLEMCLRETRTSLEAVRWPLTATALEFLLLSYLSPKQR